MDRTSFRFAAFVATMCLAIACSYVHVAPAAAQSGPATPAESDPATPAEAPAPADAAPAAPAPAASSDQGAPAAPEAPAGGASAPSGVAPVQEWVQPGPTETPADPSPTATGSTPTTTGSTPTTTGSAPGGASDTSGSPGGTATTPSTQRIDETPAAATEPRLDETAASASSTSGDDSSAEQAPESRAAAGSTAAAASAAVTPSKPATAAEAASTPTGQAGGTLQGLLADVRQELRSAQGQIDDLRRDLDHGAPPPPDRLTRLRTTLVRIAPMLVALEVRLQATGRLTPHLRHLLQSVRSDLRGVRVTADDLVTALRRSGARGAELRLLLRELDHFAAMASTLDLTPGLRPLAAPAAQGATPAYSRLQPVPVAGPPAAAAPPAERPAADRAPPDPRDRPGDGQAQPWSTATSPGAATASPGGAFFFAGVASLTTLLIGLGLPALRARLEVLPGRRYTAAFIAPLERPG
jgi:hypothetical protein